MKGIVLAMLSVAVLTGCDRAHDTFVCGEYNVAINVAENGDTIAADINGDAVELQLVASASGARYAGVLNDTPVELWQKGKTWTLILNDDDVIECK